MDMEQIAPAKRFAQYRVSRLGNGLVNVSDRWNGVLLVAYESEIAAADGKYDAGSAEGDELREYFAREGY
jgi:hypothetical protein